MYEMLLPADLVVADISVGNVNAVCELGVGHALRPHTIMLMQEQGAAFHFDLSHVSTCTLSPWATISAAGKRRTRRPSYRSGSGSYSFSNFPALIA